ncbi:methyltransferase domain-containing protein [Uliginosibacterium sp. H3]|uniref:Methyltransferase domain-containing protein n=1 Tax=Uliginosibacterium silvisoli TaxID=3114758 RepID=A0ABU6K6I6_9RHOO|nr:methyltransferase domain-containing protein [Uliginosibacterium sp. H3]
MQNPSCVSSSAAPRPCHAGARLIRRLRSATNSLACRVACGLGVALLIPPAIAAIAADTDALAAQIASPHRAESNRARDAYRHPLGTLEFFGLRDDQTVVEIWPGGSAWWTEILAPYEHARGRYIAAIPPEQGASEEALKGNRSFADKLASDPARYGKVQLARFPAQDIVPAGSADVVLSFRNLHNWLTTNSADEAFASFYRALKHGGTLGLEDHRARLDEPADAQLKKGYVREEEAVRLAEKAGFRLVARSTVNDNPKDTKDYAEGVWTLPPTYRLKAEDRARYSAIGESDRFTLKFVKP